MLDDVKAWEGDRPRAAPELLAITKGSGTENRAPGFSAPVLLDQTFGAAQVFGAGGTPSLVIVDGSGRVESAVGAGADEVLALARAIVHGKRMRA